MNVDQAEPAETGLYSHSLVSHENITKGVEGKSGGEAGSEAEGSGDGSDDPEGDSGDDDNDDDDDAEEEEEERRCTVKMCHDVYTDSSSSSFTIYY